MPTPASPRIWKSKACVSWIDVSNSNSAVKLLKTMDISALEARSDTVGLIRLSRTLSTPLINVMLPAAKVTVPVPTHVTHFCVKLSVVVGESISFLLPNQSCFLVFP